MISSKCWHSAHINANWVKKNNNLFIPINIQANVRNDCPCRQTIMHLLWPWPQVSLWQGLDFGTFLLITIAGNSFRAAFILFSYYCHLPAQWWRSYINGEKKREKSKEKKQKKKDKRMIFRKQEFSLQVKDGLGIHLNGILVKFFVNSSQGNNATCLDCFLDLAICGKAKMIDKTVENTLIFPYQISWSEWLICPKISPKILFTQTDTQFIWH